MRINSKDNKLPPWSEMFTPIWYIPNIGGRRYAGVIGGIPGLTGDGNSWTVPLNSMDLLYRFEHQAPEGLVKFAPLECIQPREVGEIREQSDSERLLNIAGVFNTWSNIDHHDNFLNVLALSAIGEILGKPF